MVRVYVSYYNLLKFIYISNYIVQKIKIFKNKINYNNKLLEFHVYKKIGLWPENMSIGKLVRCLHFEMVFYYQLNHSKMTIPFADICF